MHELRRAYDKVAKVRYYDSACTSPLYRAWDWWVTGDGRGRMQLRPSMWDEGHRGMLLVLQEVGCCLLALRAASTALCVLTIGWAHVRCVDRQV